MNQNNPLQDSRSEVFCYVTKGSLTYSFWLENKIVNLYVFVIAHECKWRIVIKTPQENNFEASDGGFMVVGSKNENKKNLLHHSLYLDKLNCSLNLPLEEEACFILLI